MKKVLDNDPAFVATSERRTIWSLWVVLLRENLCRSVAECPLALDGALDDYMAEKRKAELIQWLKLAQDAIRDWQVTIHSAFEKAVETNLLQLQGRVSDGKYVIDKETILAALGRVPFRPQTWGISGEVALGVDLCCPPGGTTALIAKLQVSESTKPDQRV